MRAQWPEKLPSLPYPLPENRTRYPKTVPTTQQRDKYLLDSSSIAPNNRCRAKKNRFRSIVTWRMQRNATVEGGFFVAHSVCLSWSRQKKVFLILHVQYLTTVVELKRIDSDQKLRGACKETKRWKEGYLSRILYVHHAAERKKLLVFSRTAPNNRCQAKKFQFRSKLTWRMQRSATVEGGLLVAHFVGLSCSREGKIFLILQV